MPKKRFTAEQIIPKLREAEVDQAKGRTVAQTAGMGVAQVVTTPFLALRA